MRLITKETDYAIRAVMNLARRPGRFVSSQEISAEDGIPLQFLRRILQRLLKAGLVTSQEGVTGGARLRADPKQIRVLDIMSVFQGKLALSECMFRKRICANRDTCILRRRIKQIEKSLEAQFAGVSIADLLREGDLDPRKKTKCRSSIRPTAATESQKGRQPRRGAR